MKSGASGGRCHLPRRGHTSDLIIDQHSWIPRRDFKPLEMPTATQAGRVFFSRQLQIVAGDALALPLVPPTADSSEHTIRVASLSEDLSSFCTLTGFFFQVSCSLWGCLLQKMEVYRKFFKLSPSPKLHSDTQLTRARRAEKRSFTAGTAAVNNYPTSPPRPSQR